MPCSRGAEAYVSIMKSLSPPRACPTGRIPPRRAAARPRASHRGLPDGARHVLVLVGIYGFSHAEAAHALGLAEGTCKAQLHRARGLLTAALGLEKSMKDSTQKSLDEMLADLPRDIVAATIFVARNQPAHGPAPRRARPLAYASAAGLAVRLRGERPDLGDIAWTPGGACVAAGNTCS